MCGLNGHRDIKQMRKQFEWRDFLITENTVLQVFTGTKGQEHTIHTVVFPSESSLTKPIMPMMLSRSGSQGTSARERI